jgi:hypothetical protein
MHAATKSYFAEKIMRKEQARAKCLSNFTSAARIVT